MDGKEDKSVPVHVDEIGLLPKEEGGVEGKIMEALQGVPWNARAEQPDEFFQTYSNTRIWVPVLMLYLLVLTTYSVIHSFIS